MKMTLMVKEVPAILRKLSGTNSNRNVMGPCLLWPWSALLHWVYKGFYPPTTAEPEGQMNIYEAGMPTGSP